LRELAQWDADCPSDTARKETDVTPIQQEWLDKKRQYIEEASTKASLRLNTIDELIVKISALAEMDYKFLFDPSRHLLSIGYNVAEQRRDTSFYDLLASEARLCCFVAIAQGQIPQESWFALGRLLANTQSEPVLLSWSGSMFEYLMPNLVMPSFENTLLDQTCKSAVARQIEYGTQRDVPWGISESGYNTVDVNLNYQYRAFGVPGLGLKRGLVDDLVVAPYASALALMVAPEAACVNLQRLAKDNFLGQYGFFEAIDYTPVRQRRGQHFAVIHAYMAHHQGMSLLALSHFLLAQPMQRRFMADRLFQSVMLLLQERIPTATALFSHAAERFDVGATAPIAETPIRVFNHPNAAAAEVQLLSNGRYHVMVNHAGSGYSRWKDLAVTRWFEDSSSDQSGSFCYIRDVPSGEFWSTSYQPTLKMPAAYEAIFSEGRAEFRRSDMIRKNEGQLDTHTEIVVSPEDDIELRRVRITNRSRQQREIDVTSYAEVVLALAAGDALHPAFSKLFIQTEILPDQHAILCTRRPRALAEQDRAPWMLHLMMVHGGEAGVVSYETDRSRFIGRTRTTESPLALTQSVHLSNTQGSVLDPIVAIRQYITLNPGKSVTINIVTGAADSRAVAMSLIEKYQDRHLAERVFDLAWTHSQVVLRQLNASEAEAQLHNRLAAMVIYANDSLRAEAIELVSNQRGQSGLWGYAISGDLPIVLLQISSPDHIDLVRQLV
ncbi:MAG: glucoamylase family protein, partial [Deefgea sp.]